MLRIVSMTSSLIITSLSITIGASDDPASAFLYLGFDAKDFSELADQAPYRDLKLTNGKGVVAEVVYEDSVAYRSGLRSGDVIASSGKKPIDDKLAFEAWFTEAADGHSQPIKVYRHFPNQSKKWQSATFPLSILKDPKYVNRTNRAKSFGSGKPKVIRDTTGIRIGLNEREFYISKGGRALEPAFAQITLGGQEPIEGFFRVKGKAERLRLKSDNQRVVRIYGVGDEIKPGSKVKAEHAPAFVFAGPGVATITAEVADLSASAKIIVVEIPASIGDESKTVIEKLGLPDSDEEVLVEWPNTEVIDNIFYEPRPNHPIRASHWRYAKYPGAVLSIVESKFHKLATSSSPGD